MSLRKIVDRWHPRPLPELWEKARIAVLEQLRDLERIFGVVHDAAEYPTIQFFGRFSEPDSGSNTSITSSTMSDITGCETTFTPDVAGLLYVHATFLVQCTLFGAITQLFRGGLKINGTLQDPLAITSASAVNDRRSITQFWTYPVDAGVVYTVKLTGLADNVTTNYDVIKLHTGFIFALVPALYLSS